jgi:hypothetical protein
MAMIFDRIFFLFLFLLFIILAIATPIPGGNWGSAAVQYDGSTAARRF